MPGPARIKHRIKRVDRFVGNRRIEISDAMSGVITWLLGRSRRRIVLALDWVDVRGFKVLELVATFQGRGVPLLWATYEKWKFHKSQNQLEDGLMRLFVSLIPDPDRFIVVADAGFLRAEFARTLQTLGLHYVIRINPKVLIQHSRYSGNLLQFPVHRGMGTLLRDVAYRSRRPVKQHVVVWWQACKKEPWYLVTDIGTSAAKVAKLYARRMKIEEVFRDHKNTRWGFSLRQTGVHSAQRLQRLLLIVAVAYLLLIACGWLAQDSYPASYWGSTSKAGFFSLMLVATTILYELPMPLRPALAKLRNDLIQDQP
jgi:hypothetical protein